MARARTTANRVTLRRRAAPQDQDRAREQPSGPRHDRSDRPSEHRHERAAEFEHGGRHGRPEHPEPHDPGQHIHAGPGDEQGEKHLHGEVEAQGDQIADKGRKAERSRLPIEGQGGAEGAVRVPQREKSVMDLCPRERGPGNDLADEVGHLGVMGSRRGGRRNAGTDRAVELVEGTKRPSVCQRRRHHGDAAMDPSDAECVGQPATGGAFRTSPGRFFGRKRSGRSWTHICRRGGCRRHRLPPVHLPQTSLKSKAIAVRNTDDDPGGEGVRPIVQLDRVFRPGSWPGA